MATVIRQKEITTHTQLNDGTTEEHREPVFVYLHCSNQACLRYHNLQSNLDFEIKVPGIREETSFTYKDRGGDSPGIENSHIRYAAQDTELETCSECGGVMNVSGHPSIKLPTYGVGPGTGLQGAERAAAIAASKVAAENQAARDEVGELKQQLAYQQKLLESLLKKDDSPKAPGPKPKAA